MSKEPALKDILEYTPQPLRFGTSGVRAKVTELTDIEVYCLTRGTLAYFEQTGKITCNSGSADAIAIPLAGDLRPSTERLLQATAKAIADAGYQVDYVGRIPTPALTYYALQKGVASFVVTGSHIPADRNGQKANRCDGEVLKSDEAGIVRAVSAFRDQEYNRPAGQSLFDAKGMFKPQFKYPLPDSNPSAAEVFQSRYRKVFPTDALKGLRVLFFEYSAVGRELIPQILENAGAEVVRAGRSEEFIPLDTEAISDHHLQMLADLAGQQSGQFDAIVSTDGDSDRPLVIGLQQSGGETKLQFIPGDLLGAIVADALKADAVAVPISANPALEEFFNTRGISVLRTRIGSPYVIEAMETLKSQGKQRVMAWEANGGFLLGSAITLEKGVLEPLPTRDATLPMLTVLQVANQRQIPLAQLLREFPPCYGKSDLLDEFPQEDSRLMVEFFKPEDDRIKTLEFVDGAVRLLDADNRKVGVWPQESGQAKSWLEKKRLLESVFSPAEGFAEIVKINVLDGIRCYFANGEIAHVRPSGNAPQLRIYAFASTPERAREIAALAVKEPDGLLRRLQALVVEKGSNGTV